MAAENAICHSIHRVVMVILGFTDQKTGGDFRTGFHPKIPLSSTSISNGNF